jgi:hypothetical protein
MPFSSIALDRLSLDSSIFQPLLVSNQVNTSREDSKACHLQICHQRFVLRKFGLIANNIKRRPTTSKTNPRTLLLCVFIIVPSCPSCENASQTPTIANIALTIKFIFYSFLNWLQESGAYKATLMHLDLEHQRRSMTPCR